MPLFTHCDTVRKAKMRVLVSPHVPLSPMEWHWAGPDGSAQKWAGGGLTSKGATNKRFLLFYGPGAWKNGQQHPLPQHTQGGFWMEVPRLATQICVWAWPVGGWGVGRAASGKQRPRRLQHTTRVPTSEPTAAFSTWGLPKPVLGPRRLNIVWKLW